MKVGMSMTSRRDAYYLSILLYAIMIIITTGAHYNMSLRKEDGRGGK